MADMGILAAGEGDGRGPGIVDRRDHDLGLAGGGAGHGIGAADRRQPGVGLDHDVNRIGADHRADQRRDHAHAAAKLDHRAAMRQVGTDQRRLGRLVGAAAGQPVAQLQIGIMRDAHGHTMGAVEVALPAGQAAQAKIEPAAQDLVSLHGIRLRLSPPRQALRTPPRKAQSLAIPSGESVSADLISRTSATLMVRLRAKGRPCLRRA